MEHSLSLALMQVLERAMFHIDNCYKIPHLEVTGHLCKTNISSNTAFRGFGGPQGMFCMESILYDVAGACGVPAEVVSGCISLKVSCLSVYVH